MNRHWFKVNAVLVVSALLFLLGCQNQSGHGPGEAGGVFVPIEEDIPYLDVDHTPVQQISRTYEVGSAAIPESVAKAKGYLSSPPDYRLRSTSILVGDYYSIQEMRDGRLLVLEQWKNELHEYDPVSREVAVVATSGEGPGELHRSQDLAFLADSAYVARADRRVSVFGCHQLPCSYARTFAVESKITSVTTVDDSLLAVHGVSNIPRTTDISVSLDPSEAVTIVDMNGTRLGGFGDTYDVHGHWMLVRDFVESVAVEYLSGPKRYVVVSRRFPDVHVFASDGHLEKTFTIVDFTIGRQRYNATDGRLSVVTDAYSEISNIVAIEGGFVVVEATTRRARAVKQGVAPWDVSIDYYLVNIETDETDYLGRINQISASEARRLSILPRSVVVDRAGELYQLDRR